MEMDRTHKSAFYASADLFLNPNRNSIKFTPKCNLFLLSCAITLHPQYLISDPILRNRTTNPGV